MLFFRTIDRYVAREFMRLFLIFITAAPLLFILGDWTDNVGRYSEQGIPIDRVALSYLYQLPLFISWSFPVAALIATIFTVGNMARHAEMTAAKAGGISFFRALAVLPLLGILLTAAGLALTEVVPVTTVMKREILGEVIAPAGDMRHEFVYTSRDGHVVTIRRLVLGTSEVPASLGGITVEQVATRQTENGETPWFTHVSARSGRWDEEAGAWTLMDGYYRAFTGDDASEHTWRFERLRLNAFRTTPEALMARAKEPEEMRYAELGTFIESLQRSGATPLKLMVEQAQKIAIPAATLIIILFGAPLANSSPRGGAAYGIGISLGVTVVYMMLFRITGAAGAAGTIDPIHAAWAPNVLFAFAALVLLARVRT
jgi:lipopolysaccharide export system permease protein